MKNGFIKVACVSPSLKLADCKYNADEHIAIMRELDEKHVKLAVFPELSLTGYTCGDLFLNQSLISGASEALLRFVSETAELDCICVVGLPFLKDGKLYNCAAVCKAGRVLAIVPKINRPTYGDLYEGRYFADPDANGEFIVLGEDDDVYFGTDVLLQSSELRDFCFGVEICEDLYSAYPPSASLTSAGATIICNPSASGEIVGKEEFRRLSVKLQSAKSACGYLYASSGVGESTTDGVFSGHCIISENGNILCEREPFADKNSKYIISEIDTDLLIHERMRNTTFVSDTADFSTVYFSHATEETSLTRKVEASPFIPSDEKEKAKRAERILDIQANALARRLEAAYAKTAVIGISGGLDSTLALIVACRAIDILGRDRKDIIGVTMPCFGTTKRTKGNAEKLCEELEISFRTVNIAKSVRMHFKDIGHDENNHDVVFENSQARERTQVIMDISNATGGLVVGTGDLSELVLGWATYNGDHMSMYGVNADVPKTLVRHLVRHYADVMNAEGKNKLAAVLYDIFDTPVSPELLPANKDGSIAQKTEDLVGPYELHDFYIYNFLRYGFSPKKLLRLAEIAFDGVYDREFLLKWLRVFVRRFFTHQFKRSCVPDGPKVGSVALSPRGDLRMPSDASYALWLSELDGL